MLLFTPVTVGVVYGFVKGFFCWLGLASPGGHSGSQRRSEEGHGRVVEPGHGPRLVVLQRGLDVPASDASWSNGHAPASAQGLLSRLQASRTLFRVVLGSVSVAPLRGLGHLALRDPRHNDEGHQTEPGTSRPRRLARQQTLLEARHALPQLETRTRVDSSRELHCGV